MPQSAGTKKKKGGRAPAHQNKFAFRHNPKSKKTEKILNSPNIGLCRRCHDKIEWRKTYRKYKPRTQPGKCNLCQRRNIKAAYHTICGECAWAKSTLYDNHADEQQSIITIAHLTAEVNAETALEEQDTHDTTTQDATPAQQESSANQSSTADINLSTPNCNGRKLRMCAMCTKEPVMNHAGEDEDDKDDLPDLSHLKLRERRTIERKLAKDTPQSNQEGHFENDFILDDYEDESSNGDDPDDDDDSTEAEDPAQA